VNGSGLKTAMGLASSRRLYTALAGQIRGLRRINTAAKFVVDTAPRRRCVSAYSAGACRAPRRLGKPPNFESPHGYKRPHVELRHSNSPPLDKPPANPTT